MLDSWYYSAANDDDDDDDNDNDDDNNEVVQAIHGSDGGSKGVGSKRKEYTNLPRAC